MKILVLLSALLICAGCVSHKEEYTPPKGPYDTTSTLFLDKPKDEVWQRLISGLSSRFFVINYMDKSSGFVNVSYSGDTTKYIDCGELYFMVENLKGKREYRFNAASPSERYEWMTSAGGAGVRRTMSLEGRINILLEPDHGGTKISVSAKYIVTKESDVYPWMPDKHVPHSKEIISFDSRQGASFGVAKCVSNGQLESEILGILK